MPRKVLGGLIQAASPLTDPSLPIDKVRDAFPGFTFRENKDWENNNRAQLYLTPKKRQQLLQKL